MSCFCIIISKLKIVLSFIKNESNLFVLIEVYFKGHIFHCYTNGKFKLGYFYF